MLLAVVLAALATPAPQASPQQRHMHVTGAGGITFISQSASGPGAHPTLAQQEFVLPPQAPYDLFTGTPVLPGNGVQFNLGLNASYDSSSTRYVLRMGTALASGSAESLLYPGEPMLPTINPFISTRNTGQINHVFPTHPGQDDLDLARGSILSGSIEARTGAWGVTGGWFLPQHSLPFAFTPPALPNSVPTIAPLLPETLADTVSPEHWNGEWLALPLQGVDAWGYGKRESYEFFDGALPAIYSDTAFYEVARVSSLWSSFTLSPNARIALQYTRARQDVIGGDFPLPGAVIWGGSVETQIGPEGPQPESDVFGQRTTVAALSFALNVSPNTTVRADLGRSWFSAQYFSKPGEPTPGGYAHLGFEERLPRDAISLDLYRYDPTYAPNILPYGNFANLWPVTWAWPAPWLKSDFPLATSQDTTVNRQGFAVGYSHSSGHFEGRLRYEDFTQVQPFNATTATVVGFTEPFFTSLDTAPFSYKGRQTHAAGWFAWHSGAFLASLELAEDRAVRPFPAADPLQAVDLHIPQALLTLGASTGRTHYAIGEGYFGVNGAYAFGDRSTVDIHQRMLFAGATFFTAPRSSWLIEWRRYLTAGIPIPTETQLPTFTGTRLILEQRFTF